MAGLLTKIGRIINPFDEHTLKTSYQNRGGYLGQNSATDPMTYLPQVSLTGGGSPVNPSPAENTYRQMGNVLSGGSAPLPGEAGAPSTPMSIPGAPSSTGVGGTGTRGTGGTATAPAQRQSLGYFMGKEYFDVAQLYNDQLAYLDSVYGSNLSTMRQGKQRQLDEYGRQKSSLSEALQDVMTNYNKQEEQGLGNIANYYSNLGDIYQSSQGTRENDLRAEVTDLRGRAKKQGDEGMSALERAIAEYLSNYDRSEQDLATQFSGARDQIGNTVVGDLGERLNVQQAIGQGVQTDLTPQEITSNNALIAQLRGLQQNRLSNQPRLGTNNDVNPILAYLQGLGV